MNCFQNFLKSVHRAAWILFLAVLVVQPSRAQICADPANVIYGVTNAGTIHPITVSTGIAGAQLNPPYAGNPASSSNGIGFSPLNGMFYYFKRMPGTAPQEFVSFDPATNALTMLSNCPSINFVYVGGINGTGTGYYCWDANATLFYYIIATNTWTTITSSMKDLAGNDVDSIIRKHGSGDLAIDGLGNMLMLPSSNARFAMYRMNAPLPTTPVANITVTELMPLTNPPAKFGGIALNATGEIFLNATTPSNGLYRLEQNFTLTFISTVSTAMGDLTSCNFPFGVLASDIKRFSASLISGNAVSLTWTNTQHINTSISIEHSVNSEKWSRIGQVNPGLYNPSMQFIHRDPVAGKNYYRLHYTGMDQTKQYSEVRSIIMDHQSAITVWPNPVKAVLQVQNDQQIFTGSRLVIVDPSGRTLYATTLQQGLNSIGLQQLKNGTYFATIHRTDGHRQTSRLIKY